MRFPPKKSHPPVLPRRTFGPGDPARAALAEECPAGGPTPAVRFAIRSREVRGSRAGFQVSCVRAAAGAAALGRAEGDEGLWVRLPLANPAVSPAPRRAGGGFGNAEGGASCL